MSQSSVTRSNGIVEPFLLYPANISEHDKENFTKFQLESH